MPDCAYFERAARCLFDFRFAAYATMITPLDAADDYFDRWLIATPLDVFFFLATL